MKKIFRFSNLNEYEKQLLREFEDQHEEDAMLKITHKAFDGEAFAEMLILSAETLVAFIELILLIREIRKSRDSDQVIAEEAEVKIINADGSLIEVKLKNATREALRALAE